jgi:hypothetical protein
MRIIKLAAIALLALAAVACSGIEVRHGDTDNFAAGNFRYYKWRSEPLHNTTGSNDNIYLIDPILRREVDAGLSAKGFVLDPERAQFSVDYLTAMGLRMGVASQDASNIDPIPRATPNRQVNQAMVDNANALSGVQETSNIALQFNRVADNKEVWRVVITKIVENANRVDKERLERNLQRGINQALRPLPDAG